jgi:hypothetical protein
MTQRVVGPPVIISVWEGKVVVSFHFCSELDVLMGTVQQVKEAHFNFSVPCGLISKVLSTY